MHGQSNAVIPFPQPMSDTPVADGFALPPRDPREQAVEADWERAAVVDGLDRLVRQFGAPLVMAYITGEHRTDRDGIGYLVERYGYERIVRIVRNLAIRYGEEIR